MPTSKGFSEKARELGISRQAAQEAGRAAAGKCVQCGGKPKKGRVRCKECLADAAERAKRSREKGAKA